MSFTLRLLAVLNLLGAVQGALLAFALLSIKRGNQLANRLLATILFVLSLLLLGSIAITTGLVNDYPHLSRVHHPFYYLLAPLTFLYIKALLTNKNRLERIDYLHFTPFILCVIYLLPFYLSDAAYKLNELDLPSRYQWYFIRTILGVLQGLIYVVLMVKLAWVSTENALDKKTVPKARLIVSVIIFFTVGAFVRLLFNSSGVANLVLPFFASVFVYVLAYSVLKSNASDVTETNEIQTAKKYEKSSLTPERAERFLKKLLSLMETEKPHTDRELTLAKLAERLSIPPQHLSQIINQQLGLSFNDFINGYRVEEAKKRLGDPSLKHYSVLAIAEDVGFNSKSAFNLVFKKHANMTPSEYRQIALNNAEARTK